MRYRLSSGRSGNGCRPKEGASELPLLLCLSIVSCFHDARWRLLRHSSNCQVGSPLQANSPASQRCCGKAVARNGRTIYVPASHDRRYFSCSSVRASTSMPIIFTGRPHLAFLPPCGWKSPSHFTQGNASLTALKSRSSAVHSSRPSNSARAR
jgi:hypothetical protein